MSWLGKPVLFRRSHLILLWVLLACAMASAFRGHRSPHVYVKVVCFEQAGHVYHCSNDGTTVKS